ncbi:MAG: hypothetical protein ABT05_08155 [Lautropia sp. SCN 66-9]|nr:MAG: hypothetical protein ABT05_08155 [Lautropia sp. SCN 66-9]
MNDEQGKQWTVLSHELSQAQAELTETTPSRPADTAVVSRQTPLAATLPRADPAAIDAYFDAWERLQALHERIRFFYFGDRDAAQAADPAAAA